MAFDSGMLACALSEIRKAAEGARIEKVYQPERDEIIIQMRSFEGEKKLLINAGSNNPRICFSAVKRENPQNPPMFCMLLRKYLQGSRLVSISQESFDRVAVLEFAGRDEMGFERKRFLIAELMGRYSNLIYTDENKKVVAALKTVDITSASERQILPGMTYRLPDSRGKKDPIGETEEGFFAEWANAPAERACEKFLLSTYMGLSPAICREIVYRATRHTDTPIEYCIKEDVLREFCAVITLIKEERFAPCLVFDGEKPIEYSFMPLTQYTGAKIEEITSAGAVLDTYFGERDKRQRVHQRAADILKLLTNAEARLTKKLELQRAELIDCEKGSEYKKFGDLITANIYLMKRGASSVTVCNYYDESCPNITIPLDTRLSPSQNAQSYYKKYNKAKKAKIELAKQIALAKDELIYIGTVFDSLSKAETESDLHEIRDELYHSGYASKMKNYTATKQNVSKPLKFVTSGGYTLYCGKNNKQNDYVTTKLSEKTDWWFHAKNVPGSHVLMQCNGEEPSEKDFTEAAEVAAFYSKAEGNNIAVDYTLGKHVKKPAGSKPGFVVYNVNWTAYVTPNEAKIEKMKLI